MEKFNGRLLTLLGSLFYLFGLNLLNAGAPTEQLRAAADRVVAVLKDPDSCGEVMRIGLVARAIP